MLHTLFEFAPFFAAFFWAYILFSSKADIMHSKKTLGLFMALVAVEYSINIIYHSNNQNAYSYLDELLILISLSVLPSYYLYMVSLTKETIHQAKFLWHYAPALFFFILYTIFSSTHTSNTYDVNSLHSDSIIGIIQTNKIDGLILTFIAARLYNFFQIFFYIIFGLKLWKQWNIRIKNSLSETLGKDIRLVGVISGIAITLAILGFFIEIIGKIYLPDDSLWLLLPSILFSFIFFRVGLIGFNQDFTITDLEKVEVQAETTPSTKPNDNPSEIRKELEELIQRDKIFLTPDLRISSVCEKLHTNRTYLSQVLNEELKENFNSFINKHRVNFAIELLKDPKWSNYSLDKFSELSGFGSTISMIRAFKQFKGKTPSEYRI